MSGGGWAERAPRPPSRWRPLALLAILIVCSLGALFFALRAPTGVQDASTSCAEPSIQLFFGGDDSPQIHRIGGRGGSYVSKPSTCYTQARRNSLIAAGLVVLPFVLILGGVYASRLENDDRSRSRARRTR